VFFVQNFGAKNYKAETFGFETFWQKDIGEKHAPKMLMKWTPGGGEVNSVRPPER